jgi:hypothetical protein
MQPLKWKHDLSVKKDCLEQKTFLLGRGGGWKNVNYRNLFHTLPIMNTFETRKCNIRNVEEKNDRLILNTTHLVLGCADNVKLLNTTKRKTEVLLVIRNVVGLKSMQRKALHWIRNHRISDQIRIYEEINSIM